MLTRNSEELFAVRFDLFRQPDHTFAAGDDLLEQPWALAERLPPQVMPVEIEQVEGEEEDFAWIMQARFPAKSALQCAEIGSPFLVKHDRLAVDDHGLMPELTRLGRDRGEAARPVVAAARDDTHPPRLYVNRETVSVPLHLKGPLRTFGRLIDEHCHTRLDARRHWVWRRLIGRLFRGRSRHAALTHKFAKVHISMARPVVRQNLQLA